MLSLSVRIKLTASGLIRLQATVRNEHPTERYGVGGLLLALPVPAVATELLDLAGRHLRENGRRNAGPFIWGNTVRDNRRGRTEADAEMPRAARPAPAAGLNRRRRRDAFRSGAFGGGIQAPVMHPEQLMLLELNST
jgi:Glycosyl hydrolase family 36 N-terminal domain